MDTAPLAFFMNNFLRHPADGVNLTFLNCFKFSDSRNSIVQRENDNNFLFMYSYLSS